MSACSVSLPESLFCWSACCTACSISRCELTPTIFKNLRMLRLKVSWSMSSSREQFFSHLFTQLDTPLVEAVDVPDHALHEHLVLVERDQPSEVARCAPFEEQHARRAVA